MKAFTKIYMKDSIFNDERENVVLDFIQSKKFEFRWFIRRHGFISLNDVYDAFGILNHPKEDLIIYWNDDELRDYNPNNFDSLMEFDLDYNGNFVVRIYFNGEWA